ncbi:MAG: RIP metalloprotease RseP [Bacteroidota bacterium]
MDLLITIGQLILSLSILIVLHEFGHFLPARLFGTRVEKFYLFFNWPSHLFKKKIGDTEWGIGMLPLGGYVKISGMMDESMDKEQMAQPPQPYEFRSKPAWQRLIIMLGGVTVNFILGFFIYAMVLWVYGDKYLPAERAEYGIYVDSLGTELGLQTGDHILAVGNQPFDRFNPRAVMRGIVLDDAKTITVNRAGKEVVVDVDNSWTDILTRNENKNYPLFTLRIPFVVGEIAEGSPAQAVGLQTEDEIVAVDGQEVQFFDQFIDMVKGRPQETVVLSLRRDGELMEENIILNDNSKIGVRPAPGEYFFDFEREDYSLSQSIPMGVQKGWSFLGDQINAFGMMFAGDIKVTESLGGMGSIAGMFGATWNWERFWLMTAALSLILAFMNLLPIPLLDGGHVVFLLYEAVSGKKPSDKFMEYASYIGFVLVISLLLFANGLDFWRWLKG